MNAMDSLEVWFLTGSQGLYGDDVLRQVADNSAQIAAGLDAAESIPVRIVTKPVVSSPEAIESVCREANAASTCVGVIAWMHTFSPAKMWIPGLLALSKPLLHLHTQFNRDLPWAEIDMDFMNLNQAAHGDREFAFVLSRLRVSRKIVVGHWQDPEVAAKVGNWSRAGVRAARVAESQGRPLRQQHATGRGDRRRPPRGAGAARSRSRRLRGRRSRGRDRPGRAGGGRQVDR